MEIHVIDLIANHLYIHMLFLILIIIFNQIVFNFLFLIYLKKPINIWWIEPSPCHTLFHFFFSIQKKDLSLLLFHHNFNIAYLVTKILVHSLQIALWNSASVCGSCWYYLVLLAVSWSWVGNQTTTTKKSKWLLAYLHDTLTWVG